MRSSYWASPDGRARLCWLLIVIVALGALVTRVPRLQMRPMHTDEAVHAAKFADLLETGRYEYDPNEYHGPTLNYFTLIPAWFSSARTYQEITETTLRIVPVVFGVMLILLAVFLVDGLGVATVVAAILVAVSPAMVFYSRYYIQEMLLVCFTFGLIVAGYRYVKTQALVWAITAGLFAGLMHATKETCIIAFGAVVLAIGLNVGVSALKRRPIHEMLGGIRPGHCVLGLASAVIVSALLCSAFLKNPRGILDSYLTYAGYLGRGGGHDTVHIHPWYYYLKMLIFARYAEGPIWTEGGIVLLALVGLFVAIRGSRLGGLDPALTRFLAFYTVAMTVVYSALTYKTPWCLLGFLHGMILLAGIGVAGLMAWIRSMPARWAVVGLLTVMASHLAFQAYRGNFVYESDSRNPYVYAHPTEEIFTAVDIVRQYAQTSELGTAAMPIQVACSGEDYWPLPWYLRSLQVEWYSSIPPDVGPFILLSSDLEGDLSHRLYQETPVEKRQMYMFLFDAPYYLWFRPNVKLLGFARKDLWDSYYQRPDPADLIEGSNDSESGQADEIVRQQ